MEKRYQIFISSTYTDLKEERDKVMRAVLDLNYFPAGMEQFPAAGIAPIEVIKSVLKDCDYYILIIGARYGSIGENGKSFTEEEYDYAVSQGIPVIAFLHGNPKSISIEKSDENDKARKKLELFRKKVEKGGQTVKYWNSPDDLSSKVLSSIPKAINYQPRVGWVRANEVTSGDAQKEIDRLQKEIAKYQKELKELQNLKEDLKKKADKCQSLEISNQDAQKEISNLQTKIEELNEELEKLKAQEEKWQNDCQAVEKSYQEKVNDVAGDLEKVLEKLKGDREFSKSSLDKDTITTPRIDTLTNLDIDTITIPGTDVSFKMVHVEGGTFMMGANDGDKDATDDEKPTHQVKLSDYWIGETQVTQELWEVVMGNNPSWFKGDPNCPVERVSWVDCRTFIRKLNKLTGKKFRLPTEAEWEFAARGGNKSEGYIYAGSFDIFDVAWFEENSGQVTHPVGELDPNELGLYDMNGNVYEWCQDRYGPYGKDEQSNPTGPLSGDSRVRRGGSMIENSKLCYVSVRGFNDPTKKYFDLGLRLAL